MVDYIVATGTHGSLILRDTGTVVRAIIKNTNGATNASGKPWSIKISNGNETSGTFSINGAEEVVVWQSSVSITLTITFTMGATGTTGLGGPKTISQKINRGTVTTPPQNLRLIDVDDTTFEVAWAAPESNGGSAVTGYRVRYGSANPPVPGSADYNEVILGVVTSYLATGLPAGALRFVEVSARNGAGFSPKAGTIAAFTRGVSRIKNAGVWKHIATYVKLAGVWRGVAIWRKKNGVWSRITN